MDDHPSKLLPIHHPCSRACKLACTTKTRREDVAWFWRKLAPNRCPVGRRHMPRGWLRLQNEIFSNRDPPPAPRFASIRLTSRTLQVQTNRNRFALFPGLDDARAAGVALSSGQIRVTSCAAHLARRSFQSVAYERRTSHVHTSS